MPEFGKVFIVGAGPGDPELITVKGLNALRQADVVLYDRLAPPELLAEAPAWAEKIDVGKEPARQRLSQELINALLIEKARDGKTVVRLKGGDPFVFGRGGEEGLALAEARIKFEIVPGVTSAVAVPAYAGIPVTHRNVSTQFTVITGHTADDSVVDWASIPLSGTLVFLMGVKQLDAIVTGLLERGYSTEMPAAMIEKGTTPQQHVVVGTLGDIEVKTSDVQPPAILVVGEVVRLQSKLDWFGDKDLLTIPAFADDLFWV